MEIWKICLLVYVFYWFLICCDSTVPLADGTWLSSSRGTWTVNSSTIVGFSSSLLDASPTSTLIFISNTDSLYLFSTSYQLFDASITLYTCLEFEILPSTVPIFYIVTVFNSSVSDRFTDDITAACSNTGYQTADNRNVLVQQGAETSLTQVLPNVIRGEYAVNFTSSSGVTSDSVTLDACNDTAVMRFNSSGTAQNVGFSNDGFLFSLYNIQINSIVYVYTYNNDSSVDGSTTYRLVCWAMSYSTFGVYASAFPGQCQTDQNATNTPTGGQLFVLTPSYTCPSTDSTSDKSDVIIIIIIVVVVIIVIIIIIIVIICVIKYKKTKKKTVVDEDLKKNGTTRDVSVETSMDSGDSFCVPWLGKGTKTISTSTTDLNSVTFYLPLKYTKRPGEKANGAPANKSPRMTNKSPKTASKSASTLQRSKTTLTVTHETTPDTSSKKPVRFIPFIGVIKKDTETKPVVDTRWQNNTNKPNDTAVAKTVKVQDELSRSKTFHDFEREFDEKNKFPDNIKSKSMIENKTTTNISIGGARDHPNEQNKAPKKGIIKVRSQDEIDQINDDNKESESVKPKSDKRVYFRRSRTIPGINYTSPYAMTADQKEYFAKRKAWVTLHHNHEQAKQNWLKEVKRKESQKAYHDWIKYKSMMAEQMRATLKRTQSQPAKTLSETLPK